MRLCIYHGGCTDGVAAAFAVSEAEPDVELFPGVYQQTPPFERIAAADDVIFVDFSYKRAVMEDVAEAAGGFANVLVLDHHASAERELTPLFALGMHGKFDMGRCGAMMAWDWFHGPESRPPLLPYIDARDRWVKEAALALPLDHVTFGVRTLPHAHETLDDAAWLQWRRAMVSPERMAQVGAPVFEFYRGLVADAKRRALMVKLDGHAVPATNAPAALASDAAGELCASHEAPFAIVWWQNSNGSYTASLRSRGDFDCSRLAERYGGGGHPGAAGFRCDAPVWEAAVVD